MYKVLIVEDERWLRSGIRVMIDTRINPVSDILEASDAEQGMAVWKRHRPEIVVSDVRMPGRDGCSLCEDIYRVAPQTSFIIISGHNEFEYARRALSFHAVDYLLKPISKEALNETLGRSIRAVADFRGDTRTVQILTEHSRQHGETDIVAAVVRVIEENYDQKLSLQDLAAKFYISGTYLSSLFKKTLGMSPIQYITNVRINRAHHLLSSTSEKISDIAAMVGYPDQGYFTKVFKRVTGKNPTDYRQKGEV